MALIVKTFVDRIVGNYSEFFYIFNKLLFPGLIVKMIFRTAYILAVMSAVILSCQQPAAVPEAENPPLFRETMAPVAFSKLTPANIGEAADLAIDLASTLRDAILMEKEFEFDNTLLVLDKVYFSINQVLYPLELIIETHPDDSVRSAARKSHGRLKNYIYDLEMNDQVFRIINSYATSEEAATLTGPRKKFLADIMLSYKKSGMNLPPGKREKIKEIKSMIDGLSTTFSANIAESKQSLSITAADTAGMAPDFLESRKQEDGTYHLDMSYPSYGGVMSYAKNEDVRKNYLKLFNNRGMPDNVSILDRVIFYRNQLAVELGYNTYAEYVLTSRMAKTTEMVWDFENDLIEKLQGKAGEDYRELLELKSKLSGKPEQVIHEWEVSFLLNKLKKTSYNLDARLMSEYFELNNVINGLFGITQELLGLRYEEVEQPDVWHPDVRMFRCYDVESDRLLGTFYMDLFPRENKYSHAAMFPISTSFYPAEGEEFIAEAALVCNFPKPEGDKPALLRHGNVVTFFHEFGHLIHAMVSRAELSMQTNIEYVALDFVEAPSQIYENWAYQKQTLGMFAQHYETGEVIPDSLLEKIIQAKNLYSGLSALKQLFYGSYDLALHDKYQPFEGRTTDDIAIEMRKKITWFDVMEGTSFQASFGHLMHYGSGYYGYMWSEVYAQDMFSVFEEKGVMNKALGMKYRKMIIEPGASRDPLDLVRDFLGREPTNKALLKSFGVPPEE